MRLLALLFLATSAYADCSPTWTRIASGIDYRCIGDAEVHVAKISPKFFQFDVAYVTNGSFVKKEAQARDARFVINANFFEKDRTPIGVIVRSGTELQGRHNSSWQSIFVVDEDGQASIVRLSDWPKYREHAWMAVQAGPRLVIKGRANKVNKGYKAARGGVCIQRNGDLVFFATPQDRKYDMIEIGRIVRRSEEDGGLACYDAMLFDGGHSTQMYIDGDEKVIHVAGDPVPVFVFAKRR